MKVVDCWTLRNECIVSGRQAANHSLFANHQSSALHTPRKSSVNKAAVSVNSPP